MRRQAIKLAKELNAPYEADNTNEEYWRNLYQEYNQEKVYNNMMDELPREVARRNFNRVLQQVVQRRNDSFRAEISVENTEPPTVLMQNVTRATRNANLTDYTLAFSTIMTQYTLDDLGRINGQEEITSPMQAITRQDFLQRIARRGPTALTAFFNKLQEEVPPETQATERGVLRAGSD